MYMQRLTTVVWMSGLGRGNYIACIHAWGDYLRNRKRSVLERDGSASESEFDRDSEDEMPDWDLQADKTGRLS